MTKNKGGKAPGGKAKRNDLQNLAVVLLKDCDRRNSEIGVLFGITKGRVTQIYQENKHRIPFRVIPNYRIDSV